MFLQTLPVAWNFENKNNWKSRFKERRQHEGKSMVFQGVTPLFHLQPAGINKMWSGWPHKTLFNTEVAFGPYPPPIYLKIDSARLETLGQVFVWPQSKLDGMAQHYNTAEQCNNQFPCTRFTWLPPSPVAERKQHKSGCELKIVSHMPAGELKLTLATRLRMI